MNSLGFIKREIESCKHEIQINKIRIENQFDKTFYKNRAEVINEKLQTLQQIKSELEAWEVCKHKMELYQEQHYGLAKETTTKISETIQIRIFVNDQNQVQTIIKALEVKENE